MLDSLMQQRANARVGKLLRGKWLLEEIVGVGGMAAVYRASHRNGARAAVKILHALIAESEELRRRFIGEGYAANRIAHPAVVSIHDDDVDDDGTPFLVMDFVEGQTLADKIQNRRLKDDELLDVAEQICSLLAAAHAAGVVHRDLKPDNLLVQPDGRIRVLDFGIARLLEDEERSFHATKTGIAFGTPGFISPEQALGHRDKVGPHTDVFALGATLFYLATGEFLHAAETPQELLIMVATVPARRLRDVAPHVSQAVAAIVDRATEMKIAERYSTASDMLVEVRAAIAARSGGEKSAETIAPPAAETPSTIPRESLGDVGQRMSLRDFATRPSIARGYVRRKRSALAIAGALAMMLGGISFIGAARGREVQPPPPPLYLNWHPYSPPVIPLEAASQAVSDEAPVVAAKPAPVAEKKPWRPAKPSPAPATKPEPPKEITPTSIIDALVAGKANNKPRRN